MKNKNRNFRLLSRWIRIYSCVFFASMLNSFIKLNPYDCLAYSLIYIVPAITSMILMRITCIQGENIEDIYYEDMMAMKEQLFVVLIPILNIWCCVGMLMNRLEITFLSIDIAKNKKDYCDKYVLNRVKS